MSSTAASLTVTNLRKRYRGGVLANDGIDLDLHPGEVFGLLGPNGAGKTTLVKQIIGLLVPDAGSITLGRLDLVAEPARARKACAYLPQGSLPIDSFRLREALELVGRIRGGDRATVKRRANELIAALELEEWRDTMGLELSGGIRRLVGFALATVWPAPVVILDEPTNDVDPLRRRLLWQQIRRLGERAIVLLVTHNVLEAEHAVDRLAVIDQGRLVAQGTPSSLKGDARNELRLQVQLAPGGEEPEKPPSFARRHLRLGRRWLLQVDEGDAPSAIDWARALVDREQAEEYSLTAATLEDAYIRLIGRQDALEPTH